MILYQLLLKGSLFQFGLVLSGCVFSSPSREPPYPHPGISLLPSSLLSPKSPPNGAPTCREHTAPAHEKGVRPLPIAWWTRRPPHSHRLRCGGYPVQRSSFSLFLSLHSCCVINSTKVATVALHHQKGAATAH